MSKTTLRLGLRLSVVGSTPSLNLHITSAQLSIRSLISRTSTRQLSIQVLSKKRPCASSAASALQKTPPPSTAGSLSSFFTPSICRTTPFRLLSPRYASTTTTTSSTLQSSSPSPSILDWNSFFTLRTSRRRFSLASSIVSSAAVTTLAFFFLSTQPELADEITKLIPTDPMISMGLLTFAATFLGWLIGPIFGNAAWKLLNRTRLRGFEQKERQFFDRIKKHRVNPMGASTNNPVPDFYGEKIGSVQGYRRWLKDQRAFNRKREGQYPGGI